MYIIKLRSNRKAFPLIPNYLNAERKKYCKNFVPIASGIPESAPPKVRQNIQILACPERRPFHCRKKDFSVFRSEPCALVVGTIILHC